MATQLLTQRLEKVFNRIIQDSGASLHARALEGRIILVSVQGIGVEGFAIIRDGQICVVSEVDKAPEISISGTPTGLFKLMRFGPDPAVLLEGNVRIEGDGAAMLEFKALLGALDIDAEEELAQIFGDPVAHQLANGARVLGGWASDVADSSLLGIAETLVEESKLLPSRPRAQRFVESIDQLRDDMARLEQRVARFVSNKKDS